MAKPNMETLVYIAFWETKGPAYTIVMLLAKDETLGYIFNLATIYPDRSESKSGALAQGATEAEAITSLDEVFAQVLSGTTMLGGGWSEPSRTIVRGTRAEMLAALKAKNIDERALN